jgi:hypothetical protein
MESSAAVEAAEAIGASVSALAVFVGRAPGNGEPAGGSDPAGNSGYGLDPLRDQADACLDGLAELARTEARLAALKVQLVAGYAETEKAMTPPSASPQDRMVRDQAVTAEIAGGTDHQRTRRRQSAV